MKFETKINSLLPEWERFDIRFFGLIRESEGGWSVNDSWTARTNATREETINLLRDRWEVFKLNYLKKARVKNITNESIVENEVQLEVDYTTFADLTRADE